MNNIVQELAAQHGIKTQAEVEALDSKNVKHLQIGENTYSMKLIGGRKGIQIALQLKGIALPLIGTALDGMKNEDDYIETPKTFAEMATRLSYSLAERDMDKLIFEDLLFDVKLKKKGEDTFKVIDWDEHLTGNYGDFIPLIAFSLKENFSSFFTGSGMMNVIREKIQAFLG